MSSEDDRAADRKKKKEIGRRRAKVLEMYNRGVSETEMAEALGVNQSTISRDISALSSKARDDFQSKIFRDQWLDIQRTTALHEGDAEKGPGACRRKGADHQGEDSGPVAAAQVLRVDRRHGPKQAGRRDDTEGHGKAARQ